MLRLAGTLKTIILKFKYGEEKKNGCGKLEKESIKKLVFKWFKVNHLTKKIDPDFKMNEKKKFFFKLLKLEIFKRVLTIIKRDICTQIKEAEDYYY